MSKSTLVREELEKFAEDAPTNLRSLKGRLGQDKFQFSPARGVPLPKFDAQGSKTGKFRPLVIARVEDRIVQRAILNVLTTVDELAPYIRTKYSFGGIKGNRNIGASRRRADSLSAVPAAIKAVLDAIDAGAKFVACADIRSFFTRISKAHVTSIVAQAVHDPEFTSLFSSAIEVELSNLAELRERAAEFPIEDLGVAQGNCLSPMLGNIVLAGFDADMNEGDCRCIRYIDDFVILAPTKAAADAKLKKARKILAGMDMQLAEEKSAKGGLPIEQGFDFLGINICRGAIRPTPKARSRFLESVKTQFSDSVKAMREKMQTRDIGRGHSVASTLKRVDGMVNGWGKHYWFCNDSQIFANLDKEVAEQIARYLGEYARLKQSTDLKHQQKMLGISLLEDVPRSPFLFPKTGKDR